MTTLPIFYIKNFSLGNPSSPSFSPQKDALTGREAEIIHKS